MYLFACLVIFHAFVVLCCHSFKIALISQFFQEHVKGVERFGFKSGPTFCRSGSGTKLFAKVILTTLKIFRFPFLDGDIARSLSYCAYISQDRRFAQVCSNVSAFKIETNVYILTVLHTDSTILSIP